MNSSKLLLMRHAKSDWDDRSLSDHQRPLNRRGIWDTPRMADWIESVDAVPDLILCSTATRTRQTAQLLLERWSAQKNSATPPAIEHLESLYLSSAETIFRLINEKNDSAMRLMVIAHNPAMTSLTSHLANQSVDMPTAAVAVFAAAQDGFQLESFMRPKGLPDADGVDSSAADLSSL